GETAQLKDPKIEDKETRPPPRYNEGTLVEAMRNAWRFVDDEVLRERLKEAKGIGTPATRAEIIGGLKRQSVLVAQGKNIVPTMKRVVDSLIRKKGVKPPAGYKTSISICGAFLKQHAPKKADGEVPGKLEPKPVSPAQILFAEKIALGKGVVIPIEAKTNSAA